MQAVQGIHSHVFYPLQLSNYCSLVKQLDKAQCQRQIQKGIVVFPTS